MASVKVSLSFDFELAIKIAQNATGLTTITAPYVQAH